MPHDASLRDIAQAWHDEIRRRGHKASIKNAGTDRIEATFTTCPFGGFSISHPGLVCEIHRRMEEGFLSTAGQFTLTATEKKCKFILHALKEAAIGHSRPARITWRLSQAYHIEHPGHHQAPMITSNPRSLSSPPSCAV